MSKLRTIAKHFPTSKVESPSSLWERETLIIDNICKPFSNNFVYEILARYEDENQFHVALLKNASDFSGGDEIKNWISPPHTTVEQDIQKLDELKTLWKKEFC